MPNPMIVDYEGLKKILDQFSCGVILAGEDGEILVCNGKAPALLQTDPIDLMERGVAAAPAWSGLASAIRSACQTQQLRQSVEASHDGKRFSITVVRDGLCVYGKACIVAMIDDITRQKDLEELCSGFFSEFLRRIKGPLTSVKTALSVLSSDQYASLDTEAREVANLGHEEVRRLHALLSDMGDLFALDSPNAATDLFLENVEVRSVINRCLRRVQKGPHGLDRRIAIALPEGGPPLCLVADYEKLGLVLYHLLENALAYSPASEAVYIKAAQAEGMIEIRVEDQGIGISPADMPQVFNRFFRSSDPAAAKSEGGGLGLFLARGFTRLMGGTLVLESRLGKGTTAVIRLPRPTEGGWIE